MSEPTRPPRFLLLTDVATRGIGIDYLVAVSTIRRVQRLSPERQLVILDDGTTLTVELPFAFLARRLETVDPVAELDSFRAERKVTDRCDRCGIVKRPPDRADYVCVICGDMI